MNQHLHQENDGDGNGNVGNKLNFLPFVCKITSQTEYIYY